MRSGRRRKLRLRLPIDVILFVEFRPLSSRFASPLRDFDGNKVASESGCVDGGSPTSDFTVFAMMFSAARKCLLDHATFCLSRSIVFPTFPARGDGVKESGTVPAESVSILNRYRDPVPFPETSPGVVSRSLSPRQCLPYPACQY